MKQLWSLHGLSWPELIKRTCRKSWEDQVLGQSARLAFYFFFALFPSLLLLLILLSAIDSGSQGREALRTSFTRVLPPGSSDLLVRTTQQLNAKAVFGMGAIVAGLYAVWGALNGTWAMMTVLNKVYEVEEERRWWQLFAVMFGLTISLSALCLMALVAISYGSLLGNVLNEYLGTPPYFYWFWWSIEWAVIVVLLVLSLAVIYRFGPNLKVQRWQWSIPGAAVAVTLWISSTILLQLYEAHFSSSRIYGGLNSVATLLLWLDVTGAAIFIGAETNSEIEKAATTAGHST